jgi:hypothetical protein
MGNGAGDVRDMPASSSGKITKTLSGKFATHQRPYEESGKEEVQEAVVCEKRYARQGAKADDTDAVIVSDVSNLG